jgi:hypothetical protein
MKVGVERVSISKTIMNPAAERPAQRKEAS